MTRPLIAIGFVSLLGQVALLRELNVASYGSELVYLLALGVWLLGTALGAFSRSPWRAGAPDRPPRGSALRALFLVLGLLLPAAALWARASRQLLGGVRGAYLGFPAQLLTLVVALLPVAFISGLLFRWAARRGVAAGRTLAAAYALESVGALAGGAAATAALAAGLSNLATLLLCALAATVVAGLRNPLALAWGAALVGALAASPRLDQVTTAWSQPGLVETRDSPYGRVTLTAWQGQVNVFQNDALAYETGGTAAEEFVHLAALQHPHPRRVLILGGGAAGLAAEVLKHEPEVVRSVEMDPVMHDMLARRLPVGLSGALRAPGVSDVIADPRRYLARAREVYDLVLVGMPEPSSGQANRFYTREFFAACAARLAPGGRLALRLPAAENLWTPPVARRTASVVRALRTAFGDVLVLPGASSLVLASASPLERDPAPLLARMRERGLRARLVTPAYVAYRMTDDRVAQVGELLAATQVPANSDARPVCYAYTLMLWLSKFYPRAGRFDPTGGVWSAHARAAWLWGLGAAGVLLAWLLARRPPWRGPAVVAVAGAAGMLTESLVLLAYQAREGALYQDLGLLLMVFMAGLALGAAAVNRLAWGRLGRRAGRALGAGALLGVAVVCLLLAARLGSGGGMGLAEAGLWLVAAGMVSAAVFASASHAARDQARAVGPLYGADLLGGGVASLLGSLALIPMLGLSGAALLTAVVALIALLGA